MNEPIPVSLAVRVVERAIRECDAATPGDWYETGGRAGRRASLEFLRLMLGREDRDYPVNEWIAQAVAPLISHYDATAPGWRTE